MSALDAILPVPPKEITASDFVKPEKKVVVKEEDMSFWKKAGITAASIGLISAGMFVADWWHQYENKAMAAQTDEQKAADQKKIANQTLALSNDEDRDLQRIQKFCFGWPWEKDAPTCKVWLKHYRGLKTYSDGDLFKEEDAANAQNALSGLQQPETPAGNVQSPSLR